MKAMQKNSDAFFMSKALEEAEKAILTGDWPVGCVIVLDGKIISSAHNAVYSTNNKINHAEIVAINKVSNTLSTFGNEATMYVTYEPCPMCLGAILVNHFKRVVYGPDMDNSGGMHLEEHLPSRFNESKYKFEKVNNVLIEKCESVFLKGNPKK